MLQSQVEPAVRSRQIAVSVLAGMISRVTEGGHTFGGYGICVSALTTVEIVQAVERSTAFLSEYKYVKADTAHILPTL